MLKNQILIIVLSLTLAILLFAIVLILSKPGQALEEQKINTTNTVPDQSVLFPRRTPQGLNSGVRACNPNYSGCLLDDIGDFDCEGSGDPGPNYTGRVQVLGLDVFNLDKDQNGWACDKGDF